MKTVLLLAALSLPAFAQEKAVQLSPEVAAKCAAEGGCVLVSRARVAEVLRSVGEKAFEAGKKEAVDGACRKTKEES